MATKCDWTTAMPPYDSASGPGGWPSLVNAANTRRCTALTPPSRSRSAEVVWLVRGGDADEDDVTRYLIEEAGGVVMFDTGIEAMAPRAVGHRRATGSIRRS